VSDGISGRPVERVQTSVGRRLVKEGWVLLEGEPFGPPGAGSFSLPAENDFAVTMRVLHALDGAGEGPSELIAAGVIGID
jgi:hypothetical protein